MSRNIVLALLVGLVAAGAAAETAKTDSPFKGMHYRLVGPFRGGRVLAVAGVSGQPGVFYMGSVAGGVWKTTDSGANWQPLFDKQPVASIGALAIADSDPSVVYAGTGEACIRGNHTHGDGVYKSTDGGRSWSHVGLSDTRHVGAVAVHPHDPNTVLVAALGHLYGPNQERGVFRTVDGGKTWQKVLYLDENTGAADVVFDPHDAGTLYASLWQVRRQPWRLDSGGPGSGLYKSADGGATWKKLEGHGLPKPPLGRIGVSVSGADGGRVYALIEAQEGGLYRSDDAGETWTRVNDDERYRQRAWYFSHVFADPQRADTVYVLNTGLFRSTDGGKSFELLPAPHGDHHGLWIDPKDPQRLIDGNDGGATVSLDGGKTWSRMNNQPTAQFYHVTADNAFPYRLYGSQQDTGSVGIASRGESGVIEETDWYWVGGGEAGSIAPDPRDPSIVYATEQGAVVTRFDKRSEQAQYISPWPLDTSGMGAGSVEHRFQWTEPILVSPHDANVVYTASEVVWKTSDRGASWTAVSPDLTRNDKSKQLPSGGPITLDITNVEYYDTIFALAESPLQKDLLWAGTDDGLIHVTRDGGKSWQNVTPKALPEWSTVSLIDPSPHEAGGALVAVDRHRLDDLKPYILRTRDYGKSWTSLGKGIPDGAFVHAVREDPRRKGLLFAGTELGVYVSLDDGASFQPLQLDLPMSPVSDLLVKDDDLVIATNGRSFWILDAIQPIRQLGSAVTGADAYLFSPGATVRLRFPDSVDRRRPVGENPPNGAIIDYWLKDAAKSEDLPNEVTLDILDDKGTLVRHFSSKEQKKLEQPPEWPDLVPPKEKIPAEKGLNRFSWDLRWQAPTATPGLFYSGNPPVGPVALPGRYQVRLTAGGRILTAPLEIKPDPRVKAGAEELGQLFSFCMQIRDAMSQLHQAVNQIRAVRGELANLKKRSLSSAALDGLDKKIAAVEEQLVQVKLKSSEGTLRYPSELNEQLYTLAGMVDAADGAPTQGMRNVFQGLRRRLDVALAAWKDIVSRELPALNDAVKREELPALYLPPSEP